MKSLALLLSLLLGTLHATFAADALVRHELTVDGGAGTNEVTVTGSLPPGVELDVVAATQTVDLNIRRHAVNVSSDERGALAGTA